MWKTCPIFWALDQLDLAAITLVLIELASGYLLTEAQCEDRSCDTWEEQIQSWWKQTGWRGHFMVSDRAKALIKLALDGLDCVSTPDLFHALHALAQLIGSALGRQSARLAKQVKRLNEQIATPSLQASGSGTIVNHSLGTAKGVSHRPTALS